MRQSIWSVVLLLGLLTTSASGHGLRRPAEVRPSYYVVPTYSYYVPVTPRFYYSATPIIVAPPIRFGPVAAPLAAPPSLEIEPPLADPPRRSSSQPSVGSTSLRTGSDFYSVLSGPKGMDRADGQVSVAFWNMSGRTVTLRVAGYDHVLSAGRRVTLDLPRSFAWQMTGREPEATRIADGISTAELLIRR